MHGSVLPAPPTLRSFVLSSSASAVPSSVSAMSSSTSHTAVSAQQPQTSQGQPPARGRGRKGKEKDMPLQLPNGHDRLLLHSCCAPCSGEPMQKMVDSGIDFTIFFYNPNIHPVREYEIRKEENIRFAQKHNITFIDADYDSDNWFERCKGLEFEPERGERCTVCFDMRFERTALYAHEHGFRVFTSSLGISRWKDMNQINGCGHRAAARYPDVEYWDYNWRKGGGSARMIEIAKAEHFYQQEYCGCVYSLRDSNKHRVSQGRERIRIGELYYGMPPGEKPDFVTKAGQESGEGDEAAISGLLQRERV